MLKIIKKDLIKSIVRTMQKTTICSKNSLFIIVTSTIRKASTKSFQRYLKKNLIKFLTINKLLTLTLSYIELINFDTLKILLLLFRDALLKSKRENYI